MYISKYKAVSGAKYKRFLVNTEDGLMNRALISKYILLNKLEIDGKKGINSGKMAILS